MQPLVIVKSMPLHVATPNTVRIGSAGMERKNGGGRSASSAELQAARATVVRASCPESPIAKQSANRTALVATPVLLAGCPVSEDARGSACRPARREPDISFCRARHSDLADHVDCLADEPDRCAHSLCFGSCGFCLHPRRNEIAARTEAARHYWSEEDDRGLATVA